MLNDQQLYAGAMGLHTQEMQSYCRIFFRKRNPFFKP